MTPSGTWAVGRSRREEISRHVRDGIGARTRMIMRTHDHLAAREAERAGNGEGGVRGWDRASARGCPCRVPLPRSGVSGCRVCGMRWGMTLCLAPPRAPDLALGTRWLRTIVRCATRRHPLPRSTPQCSRSVFDHGPRELSTGNRLHVTVSEPFAESS